METVWGALLSFLFVLATALSGYVEIPSKSESEQKEKSEQTDKSEEKSKSDQKSKAEQKSKPEQKEKSEQKGKSEQKSKSEQRGKFERPDKSKQADENLSLVEISAPRTIFVPRIVRTSGGFIIDAPAQVRTREWIYRSRPIRATMLADASHWRRAT